MLCIVFIPRKRNLCIFQSVCFGVGLFCFYVFSHADMLNETFYFQGLPTSGVLYGYRVNGPQGWEHGHRFDSNIILLDPYAKLVSGRNYFGVDNDKPSQPFGTYDFDSSPFDWGVDYQLPNLPEVL